MSRRRIALFLLVVLTASGCKVGPNYKRPTIVTPDKWREMEAANASVAELPWWEMFQDPQLQELIRIALVENKDLKIAVERIEEARAIYGFTRSDLYPAVDANAGVGGIRFSEGSLSHTPEADRGISTDRPIFTLGLGLSWELDFFGRIRRATEAQRANLLATEEARRTVVLTLVSDVARAYMELRDFDRRLEIARRTLDSRREYVELARVRFEGGLTSEVDWRQAQAEYYRTEAFVHDFERLVAQKENEISVLLGRNPGAVLRGRTLEEQPVPPAVPPGLPSELLERRPDIRQAEQELVAANARIGEAKAMLFPRISLTASYGFASTELDQLLDASSQSGFIFGQLLQPLFNAGKNRRRVEARESQFRQAATSYERTIIRAFREVEDSLVAHRKAGDQLVAQRERVQAERKVLELAELRYRGGVAPYLEVLDAQRALFNAEIELTQVTSDRVVTLIRLYKSLGGGWSNAQPPPAPPTGPPTAPAEGGKPGH